MPITIDQPCHRIRIECEGKTSKSTCPNRSDVFDNDRDGCSKALYDTGWSLSKGKTLCPTCTRKVLERLRKKAFRGTIPATTRFIRALDMLDEITETIKG
jgi:hypothetical protein